MSGRKNILLISYLFGPQNVIGAIRPTKIAKYLQRMGYRVVVVCGQGMTELTDPMLVCDVKELEEVCRVKEWNPLRRYAIHKSRQGRKTQSPQAAEVPTKMGMVRGMMDWLYRFLRVLSDRSFVRCAMRQIRGMNQQFDVVFSTYGPHSVHTIARRVKQEGLAVRWVADFRDIVEMPFSKTRGSTRRYVKRVRKHADAISAISHGLLEVMDLEEEGTVITNGFDTEDLHEAKADERMRNELRFVYCGQMYRSQRDLRPVFCALTEVMAEGCIARGQIALHYAGKPADGEIFVQQARECGLEDRVVNHGLLSRDAAIRLQLSADVLLIAAWNTNESRGNLPGKLLEAMMMNRPVLCCVAGDVAESEAARLIMETGIGHCFEQAGGVEANHQLVAYVRYICQAFSAEKDVFLSTHTVDVYAYDYRNIACQVAELLFA